MVFNNSFSTFLCVGTDITGKIYGACKPLNEFKNHMGVSFTHDLCSGYLTKLRKEKMGKVNLPEKYIIQKESNGKRELRLSL